MELIQIVGPLASIFFVLFVLYLAAHKPNAVWIKKQLISLSLKNSISGSFALGFGSFQDQIFYYVYVKEKDGGLTLVQLPMELTKIYLDDSVKPHILMREKNTASDTEADENIFYKLYVPSNTIKQKYNGDVK